MRDTRFRRSDVGGERCIACGAVLNTHPERAEGVCRSLKCRGPVLQRRKTERIAAEAQQRAEFHEVGLATVRAMTPEELDGPRPTVLMILPSFASHLGPPPAKRLASLRASLAKAAEQAVALLAEPGRAEIIKADFEQRSAEVLSAPPEAVSNACMTCRGACCIWGGDNAFIMAEFVAWRLLTEPGTTPAGLVEEYLACLPDESFDDSCLYHSPTGCAIPRAIRSQTCNQFHCPGIVECADALAEQPTPTTVAVAADNGVPQRVGFITRDGSRREQRVDR